MIARPTITLVAGDVCRAPSGREVLILRFVVERAACEYLDDREQVTLHPSHLTFVRKAVVAERLRKRPKGNAA